MSTFVSVGNATQPFARLLEAVAAAAPQLPQPVIVQYGAASGFTAPGCKGVAFVSMEEFAHHVAAAELLILHAGAGSVIHAVQAGKVPVVMPRQAALGEHIDDHQLEFTAELAQLGKIVACHAGGSLMTAVSEAVTRQAGVTAGAARSPLVVLLAELLHEHANGNRTG